MVMDSARLRVGRALGAFPCSVDEFVDQVETLHDPCLDLDEADSQPMVFKG